MLLSKLFKPKSHVATFHTPGKAQIIQPEFLKAIEYERIVKLNTLTVNMGYDANNNPVILDIEEAPHVLIAGQTKSGKSVSINNIISQLICKNFWYGSGVNFYIADVKQVDYIHYYYGGLPHLKQYAKTPDDILKMLQGITREIVRRQDIMNAERVRDIRDLRQPMPQIVIIFDEYASLEKGKVKKQINSLVENIARIGRAFGVHLIIGIQSPTTSNGEITSPLKNNCPVRVAFSVTSKIASRAIIDNRNIDASLISERGRAWIQLPMEETKQFKGVYVSDAQIEELVKYWKKERGNL